MSLRFVLIAAICLFCATAAQAAQSGGGSSGGSNFTCDGQVCTCDGTYQDCKLMESKCIDGAILCGGKCQCAMKVPAGATPARPKAGTPARATPAPPNKM